MRKFTFFLLTACFLFHHICMCEETPFTAKTAIQQQNTKTPDFSPPKDLSGPVFPPEEFITEPGPDTNRFFSEFLSMMTTLGLLISLILLIAWFLKRMVNSRQEQANSTSIIKIIERRSLSPKSTIYLLEIEGKSLIVAESVNGVTSLAENTTTGEKETKVPSSFAKLLDNTP